MFCLCGAATRPNLNNLGFRGLLAPLKNHTLKQSQNGYLAL